MCWCSSHRSPRIRQPTRADPAQLWQDKDAQIERLQELVGRGQPEPVAPEVGEGWEALAWQLCADENGEDACNELVWEGGPIPEPWGDRWLKYEGEAKRMIALVSKHASPHPAQPEPVTDHQLENLFDAAFEHAEYGREFREHARQILASPPPAQPAQAEPVAFLFVNGERGRQAMPLDLKAWESLPHGTKFYIAAQPKREPLTDDDIARLAESEGWHIWHEDILREALSFGHAVVRLTLGEQ